MIIDVSAENGPNIRWDKVARAGVQLAIIRVTARGLDEDKLCHIHARGARGAGIRVGAYAFAQPSRGNPEAQASLARAIADDIGADGLADDAESADGLGALALSEWHVRFLTTADRPGNRCSLYTGPGFVRESLTGQAGRFADRCLWIANYGVERPDVPAPWLTFTLHQRWGNTIARLPNGDTIWGPKAAVEVAAGRARLLAEPGRVDGIAGEVDVSVLGPTSTIEDFLAGVAARPRIDLSTVVGRQVALRALGRDPGKLDGVWGSASKSSLTLVQRDLALSIDGVWGPRTDVAIRYALVSRGIIPM